MPSGCTSDSGTLQKKLLQNFSRPTGTVFCHRFFKEFSRGKESIEDEPYSERFSPKRTNENVDIIQDVVS